MNRLLAFALSAVLFTATAGTGLALTTDEKKLLDAAADACAENDLWDILAFEPRALKAAGETARRDRIFLSFWIGSRTYKTFQDAAGCNDENPATTCRTTRLVAYLPSFDLFLFAKAEEKSLEYFVVDDETGEETFFRSFPHFSPDGRRAVVLLENGADTGFALQVWHREEDRYLLEWEETSPFKNLEYVHTRPVAWTSEMGFLLRTARSIHPPVATAAGVDESFRLELDDLTGDWTITKEAGKDPL